MGATDWADRMYGVLEPYTYADAQNDYALREFLRAIGGGVIDDNDFDLGISLALEGGEAGGQEARAVPVGNDDRKEK